MEKGSERVSIVTQKSITIYGVTNERVAPGSKNHKHRN